MVSGFVWTKGTPEQFVSSPVRAVQSVTKGFDMQSLVEEAAQTMELFIATRGTPKSGKQGRIDTGHMIQSVSWRVELDGGNLIGEFGWTETQEPYFYYQEAGTRSGAMIPAMLALEDAGIMAREEFMRRLSAAMKR